MRIVIPAYFVKNGRAGGGEHLFYNLVHSLALFNNELLIRCLSAENLSDEFKSKVRAYPNIRIIQKGYPGPRFVSEQLGCFEAKSTADITLFPNYFTPFILPSHIGRVITIICDLQYRYLPQYFKFRKRIWLRLAHRITLERADKVIVISNSVYKDVINYYGDKYNNKVRIIHVPIDWKRFRENSIENPLPGVKYILSIEAHYPHKNLTTLIRAFSIISKRFKEIKLVLVGQLATKLVGVATYPNEIYPLIRELGLDDRIIVTGYVTDDELSAWYHHASVFVFPSLFEGFGMPAVESLGLGVPTITTKISAIYEVTLGECVYIEHGRNIQEWIDVMQDVIINPKRYEVSEETKKKIRDRYSMERIGREYMELFRD